MVHLSLAAEKLNAVLEKQSPFICSLLSKAGQKAFFPKDGIPGQTADAKGTKINATIGQAFEDDGRIMFLNAFKKQSLLSPEETFMYSPNYGQPQLRKLWKELILEKNPDLGSEISLPVVCSGLTHGLYIISRLFVDDNDTLVLPDLHWGNYKLIFEQADLDLYPLFDNDGFNIKSLEEKTSGNNQKKIVLLNFPNNPTGYSPTVSEAEAIIKVLKESAERGNRLLVICDDAYFGLNYEKNIYPSSLFDLLTDLHENLLAVKIDGISKEAYSWGLRVAFVTYGGKGLSPEVLEVLENKTAGIIRGTVSNVCTHSQNVVFKGLSDASFTSQVEEKKKILQQRYEAVKDVLNKHPEYTRCFEPLPFNSGYFMCIELKKHDADMIRKRLISESGVGVISSGKLLRIAYSSISKEKITLLFQKVYEVCTETS